MSHFDRVSRAHEGFKIGAHTRACPIAAVWNEEKKLYGVQFHPQVKRKIIGAEFINVFQEQSKNLGDIPYLAQGTIYPDVIESGGSAAATIKRLLWRGIDCSVTELPLGERADLSEYDLISPLPDGFGLMPTTPCWKSLQICAKGNKIN